jgi:hypothetical protein
MRKTILITIALLIAVSAYPQQQLRLPAASPSATLTQTVGLTDITIKYSRPGVKGRQIWGSLVPYDQIWRTGANQATTINFSEDVTIGGQKLPKGTYAFFTIPGRDQWTVVFNKQAEQWGAFSHDASQDVLKLTVRPERADFREWMQFDIPEMTTDTAKIVLRWENLAVPFTVDTGSTERALTAAKNAISAIDNQRWQIPYRAADFAFQNNRMDEAKGWLAQANAVQENTATLWLKARMLQKEGKTADALRTAELAIAKATPQQKDFAADIKRLSDLWRK